MKLRPITLLLVSVCSSHSLQTVLWDGVLLTQTKNRLQNPEAAAPLLPALSGLVFWGKYWANRSEYNQTFSVMNKPMAGPSGNKHDFYSLGTYWWPNPNTTNGLPYIRRDGLVNPETFDFDSVPLSQMIMAVSNLSLAYFFTEDPRYCTAAGHFINTWFFNPATRMNPSSGLQYAQLIRGRDEGRGIGIIDAKDIAFVLDSTQLLHGCGQWTRRNQAALHEWFTDYLGWLSASSHAADEFAQRNNHGTWFDVQALTLSLHLGNKTWCTTLAQDSLERVRVQVAPNGTLPLELVRTRPMHYTWWDLLAFFELAQAVTLVEGAEDLFAYHTVDGRSLQGALDYVLPYTLQDPPQPWPYPPEASPFDHGKFFQIFRIASLKFANSSTWNYEQMITSLPGHVDYNGSVINLVWPKVEV